jgi:hypothetical protein
MFFQGARKKKIIYFFNIIYKSAILLQILLTHVSLKSTVSDELFLAYFGYICFFSEKIHTLSPSHQSQMMVHLPLLHRCGCSEYTQVALSFKTNNRKKTYSCFNFTVQWYFQIHWLIDWLIGVSRQL